MSKLYNALIYKPYLKRKLSSCGLNFKFGYNSELRNAQYFSIGDNFFSGPYGYYVTNKFIPVIIGSDVMFGPFCKIFGGDHDIKYKMGHIRYAPEKEVKGKKITIENGVWVGANTTILTNAHICEGAVIASSAVVNGYIPPYCIAYGLPAKRFKARFNKAEIHTALNNVGSSYTTEQVLKIYHEHGIEVQ